MYLPDLELHEPTTIKEATGLLRQYDGLARILAGGTDLLVDLKTGRCHFDHLISLQQIDDGRAIDFSDGTLHIGSLTTITQLDQSGLVREFFPILLDATRQMASHQIRNRATVGGNIASAVPCADLPPVLMVLGASITLCSSTESRQMAIDSFYVGPRKTMRQHDEMVTSIQVPAPVPGFGAAYARFALREGNAIAVAGVAAALRIDHDGSIGQARIALGSVSPIPKRVKPAEEGLIGRIPCEESFDEAAQIAKMAAEPISDVRGSADFRRDVVQVLTQRALIMALERVRLSMESESTSRRAGP